MTGGEVLGAIASGPRFTGTPGERAAAAYCTTVLTQHGFSVTEEPFAFSAAVGFWMVPAVGAITALALGMTASIWGRQGATVAQGAAVLGLGIALGALGVVAARRWVLSWPTHRRNGVNLVATRGIPSTWLVAHLDTKSQPVPSLVRAAALVLMAGALFTAAVVAMGWPDAARSLWWIPALGCGAGLIVARSTVGNASAGAADNASGVACVLGVVGRLHPSRPLGVVLTSAEELGLAGARAWSRARAPSRAINVDTVDDTGRVRCMTHGRRSHGLARALAGHGSPPRPRIMPLFPGLLTDGVALADAGWEVVTLSRGSLATLARIHTPGDSVGAMTGAGADDLARFLASFLSSDT